MPRRRMRRQVAAVPAVTFFKPQGTPLCDIEEVVLAVEGLEALRLADLEGQTAEAAAGSMGVSRHTFGRVLAEARQVVARALVGGLALRIEGGDYRLAGDGSVTPEERMEPSAALSGNCPENAAHKEQTMPGRGRCGSGGAGGQGRGSGQGSGQGRGQGQGQCPGQGQGQGLGRGGAGRGRGQGGGQGRGDGQGQAAATPGVLPPTVPCPACGQAVAAVAGETGPACPACGAALA